jgi:hypothetical protein
VFVSFSWRREEDDKRGQAVSKEKKKIKERKRDRLLIGFGWAD